jgi:hypothetical protein
LQPHEDLPRKTRMTTYINCWRRGSAESLAMWSLYGSNAGTVAVKTTVGQLRNAVATSAESLFLAEVSYVDWNHLTDVEDGISLCTRKELSYSHEAEVRLLMLASVDDVFASFGTPPSCIPAFHESYLAIENALPVGRGLEIVLQELLTEVVVGPREPVWIAGLIGKLMARYGLSRPLLISDRLTPR